MTREKKKTEETTRRHKTTPSKTQTQHNTRRNTSDVMILKHGKNETSEKHVSRTAPSRQDNERAMTRQDKDKTRQDNTAAQHKARPGKTKQHPPYF